MNAQDIDLTTPSVRAARYLAHLECLKSGPEAAKALMAKLLFHVDVNEGGLLGANEERTSDVMERFRIGRAQFADALYAPGAWPVAAAVAA